MANTLTPTYSFTLPEVGADTNAWGGHLNANFSTIDAQMLSRTTVGAQTMAGSLNLPGNGLNVGSGQLQVAGGNVLLSGSLTGLNGTFSGAFSAAGAASFSNNVNIAGALGVTGAVSLASIATCGVAPTSGAHLTNKTYVDQQDALKLSLTGGVMSGPLTLSSDPYTDLMAASKHYVDARDSLYLPLGGGTMSGNLTINNANPAIGLNDSNGYNYLLVNDAGVCGVYRPAASNWSFYTDTSGNFYVAGSVSGGNGSFSGTLNVSGVTTLSNNLNAGGLLGVTGFAYLNGGMSSTTGNFSGALTVTGNSTFQNNLTVNGALGVGGAGSFAGNVTAATAPSAGAHLANKTYVDAVAAGYLPLAGGTMSGNLTIQNTVPQISLVDTNGTTAHLRCDANIIGFVNSAQTAFLHYVDQSGNFTAAGNVTAYSDARLKENVQTIRDAVSLTKRMRGVFFDRIDTGEHGVGVIAQELREVIPQAVHENDGKLSVAYGNLVGVLIEAVKELSGRVEALEGK